MAGSKFPYNVEDDNREDADISNDELDLKALINGRLGYGNLARTPEPFSRTDRFTFAKNRLDLSESETPGTTLSGLVPFPMRRFDGPAIGGTSSNPSFTVSPGIVDLDPRGWSMGDVKAKQANVNAPLRFVDAVDPDFRESIRKRLKISRINQEQ